MSLRAAVAAIRKALGPYVPSRACAACKAPASKWHTTRLVALGDDPQDCPGCGGPIDHHGLPVGVDTPRGLYVLTLCTDDVQPPTDP